MVCFCRVCMFSLSLSLSLSLFFDLWLCDYFPVFDRHLGRLQRHTIETFLKPVPVRLAGGEPGPVLVIVDDPVIEAIAQVGLIRPYPVLAGVLAKQPGVVLVNGHRITLSFLML